MITDPKIVAFVNEKLRPAADAHGSALLTARALLEQAKAKMIVESLAAEKDETPIDGGQGEADSRSTITVGMLRAYLANVASYMTVATTDSGNGFTPLEQVLYVSVNAQSKF